MTTLLTELLPYTVLGIVIGSGYAIAASGLVITYATSNVFNMAHGAIGMFMAFVYWELASNQGLPNVVALLLVVAVIAPLFGALIERTMMRRMTDAPVMVSLTVTVGLLVGLIGLAQALWPAQGRSVDEFFAGRGVQLGAVFVSGQQLLTFALALAVAAGLYLLLARTRTGVGMRAIVDNRELVALHGAHPQRLSMLSWALGSSLAALAGILLLSEVPLDYFTLTLLVINAYAAAMVGKLKNLPRTILGAMILGLLLQYYLFATSKITNAIDVSEGVASLMTGLRAALPTVFLFIVMLLLPLEKLRVGQVAGAAMVRVPSWRRTLITAAVFLTIVGVLAMTLPVQNVSRLSQAVALSAILLTLVLITGYGGDVSLAQMTFAGLGGLFIVKMGIFPSLDPVSLLVVGGMVGLVGAVVAIPALRLRGLYLGLGTLAFAYATDKLVFENPRWGYSLGGAAEFTRPTVLGVSMESEAAFAIYVTLAFLLMSFVVLAIRRGTFGRLILASRDSAAACGTLGLNITTTRVALFAVSAGLAGIAGALYGGVLIQAGPPEFAMFQNLPLLLLAVIGGITSVTGAVIGGMALAFMPAVQDAFPALAGLMYLAIGGAAIALGRNPNGIAGIAFNLGRRITRRWSDEDQPVVTGDEPESLTADTEEVRLVGTP
jgi:branched-chain amino acid transport system permease protein